MALILRSLMLTYSFRFHGGPATFLFSDAVAALKNPAENHPTIEGRKAASSDSISDGTIDLDELYFKPWVSRATRSRLGNLVTC